jgi:hypothetical protein
MKKIGWLLIIISFIIYMVFSFTNYLFYISFISLIFLGTGLYLGMKAKGYRPFHSPCFYGIVLFCIVPLIGPIIAILWFASLPSFDEQDDSNKIKRVMLVSAPFAIKTLTIVLGAIWFFPVSCATGLVAGTLLVSKIQERTASSGDSLRSNFKVVAVPGINGKPFRVLNIEDIASYTTISTNVSDDKSVSFLMPVPSGSVDLERSKFSYTVLMSDGKSQQIELIESFHDGDNTIWYCYWATKGTISPESSRMFHISYMFMAFPFAFVCSLILYGIGRLLRRKYSVPVEYITKTKNLSVNC